MFIHIFILFLYAHTDKEGETALWELFTLLHKTLNK